MEYTIDANFILTATTELVNAKIPAEVVGIGSKNKSSNVFKVFKSSQKTLETLEFMGNKIEYIGVYAFEKCEKLQTVDLSSLSCLNTICSRAFWECTSISTLVFPKSNSLKNILDNSFRGSKLQQTIDLTRFDFVNCDSFLGSKCSYTCKENHKLYKEYEGNIYTPNLTTLLFVSYSTKELILPKETTILGSCCFTSTSLREYSVPDQIVGYGMYTFHWTNHLESLVLGKNAPLISFLVVENEHLKNILIPEGVTSTESRTIYGNTFLESIKFPSTLVNIPKNSFDCNKLYYATFSSLEQKNQLIQGGIPPRAFIRVCRTLKEGNSFSKRLSFLFSLALLIY